MPERGLGWVAPTFPRARWARGLPLGPCSTVGVSPCGGERTGCGEAPMSPRDPGVTPSWDSLSWRGSWGQGPNFSNLPGRDMGPGLSWPPLHCPRPRFPALSPLVPPHPHPHHPGKGSLETKVELCHSVLEGPWEEDQAEPEHPLVLTGHGMSFFLWEQETVIFFLATLHSMWDPSFQT